MINQRYVVKTRKTRGNKGIDNISNLSNTFRTLLNIMKEELIKLLEKITAKTGLNQGEISEKAGYNTNTLAEAISKGRVTKSILKKVKGVLESEGTYVHDAGAMLIENQVEIMATNRVILTILAEIQAPQQKRLPTELAGIYRRMVKDEAELVRSELKQRS